MAIGWVHYGGEMGVLLKNALIDLENRQSTFFEPVLPIFAVRDMLVQMRDGDNTNVTHYTEIATRFATADTTAAKAMMDEVEALYGILTNGSATQDQVKAAINQAKAKLRSV